MSKDMTWEELCEKAKEMGYWEFYDDGDIPYFDGDGSYFLRNLKGDLYFCKDGTIDCGGCDILAENRTYEQMYQIMEALR